MEKTQATARTPAQRQSRSGKLRETIGGRLQSSPSHQRSPDGPGPAVTDAEIHVKAYLVAFPDVKTAIDQGLIKSATEHYKIFGKQEIAVGDRCTFSNLDMRSPNNALAIALSLIRLASPTELEPWKFLCESDRDFMRTFISVVFEGIYLNAYEDLQQAKQTGTLPSGYLHWIEHGLEEFAEGTRSSETLDHWIASDPRSRTIIQVLPPALAFVESWSAVLLACATNVPHHQLSQKPTAGNGRIDISVGSQVATALQQSRSAPADLMVRVSESEGSAHIYGFEPKIVAFYLPQYHRVRENDEWWGEGFTEWTNVVKARPNFVGHHQPHVPAGKSYYDLSDPEVQRGQTALAKEYGISTFCYYMYWFDGKRLLQRPLDQMLVDKSIDHEFCICWANENWTRTWDGMADDVLIGQVHTSDSDRRFILDAIKYFRDSRYMRIDGKLALLVYRVDLLPNCRETALIWREEVRKAGLGEIHLCAVQFYGVTNPEPWGFDAAVEFPPHGWLVPENVLTDSPKIINPGFKGHIFDYQKCQSWAMSKPIPDYRWYRGVFPGWDNTARRQDTPHIFANSDPIKFEAWLTDVIRQTAIIAPREHQLVFINAWNEWGEGAHLEPEDHNGRLNLMALNSAIQTAKQQAWPILLLNRLRKPGAYLGREQDEQALLGLLRGQERAFGVLTAQLRATGINPFA